MSNTADESHENYLTEDVSNIPFGLLLKMVKSELFFPFALIAVISIKLVSKIKGRSDAISAACRNSNPIDFGDMPAQARTAFEGLTNQLNDFRWVRFEQRPCLGLRQQYEAVALHEDGCTIALCQWQHHMVVVLATEGENPVKSTETVTTEFVSFEGDRNTIITSYVPKEHLASLSLYDEGLGDVEFVSNEHRMEVAIEKHFDRLKRISPNVMNDQGACQRADQHSQNVVKHFLNLGLIRSLLPTEASKLQQELVKHAAKFEPYTRR